MCYNGSGHEKREVRSMKRLLCGLLACILLLPGCTAGIKYPTDDAYHPETDCQWALVSSAAVTRIAEGDGVLYSLVGCHLYATSTETWVTVPVCSRPDCDHDRDDPMPSASDCEAFFPYPIGVFTADGNVYVLHDSTHYENGTGYVRELSLTQVYPEQGRQKRLLSYPNNIEFAACIHRGKFYCARVAFSEDGTGKVGIYRYDLAHPSKDPVLLYGMEARPRGGSGQVGNTVSKLFAWGHHLYFASANEEHRLTWHETDLLTGETSELPAPEYAMDAEQLLILNGELLLSGPDAEDWEAVLLGMAAYIRRYLQRTAPDGTNGSPSEDFPYVNLTTDGTYLYGQRSEINENSAPTDLTLYIFDASLSPVGSVPAPAAQDGSELVFFDVLPTDGNWIVTEAFYKGGLFVLSRFPKSQIGTGQITPEPFLTHLRGQVQE